MLARWNHGGLGRFGARDFAGPLATFDELRREMNRLFFDFERDWPDTETGSSAYPRMSLEDKGAALEIRAEVPGLGEKELTLTVDANTFTLSGERKEETPEGASVERKERSAYRFARSVSLPAKVDAEKAEASLQHGVLTVTLPKAKEAQPRSIAVRGS
jgi:HSP20 family protein